MSINFSSFFLSLSFFFKSLILDFNGTLPRVVMINSLPFPFCFPLKTYTKLAHFPSPFQLPFPLPTSEHLSSPLFPSRYNTTSIFIRNASSIISTFGISIHFWSEERSSPMRKEMEGRCWLPSAKWRSKYIGVEEIRERGNSYLL